jgi:hypothetical protein
MKKLWILSILLAVALVGYSQATPGKIVRVAARTTTFDTNLPAGTQIYCIADSTNWNVKAAGVASTRTINTAWAAAEIEWIRTTVQNSATRGATNYTVAIDTTKASYQALSIQAATTSYSGVMTGADKTKLDGLTTGGGVYTSEAFEAVGDSLTVTGSGYYTVTLAVAAKDSSAFTVSVNGQEIRHIAAGKYTVMVPNLAAKRVQLNIPVYKYDLIMVSYMK